MCGIVGILRWDGPPPEITEIERMTAAVAHRGPDGMGSLIRDRVALGHRRLAIIDLETGDQPMRTQDGAQAITYNGELYNYRELREVLVAKGHRFVSRSDTEVVLHAYREWGADCVTRFRGMFAFGLADFARQQIVVARDHFGIKPLYYRRGAWYFAFASELQALRQVADARPRGSLRALDLYLRFRYIPAPDTIYEDIFKLPPASFMTVGFDGRVTPPGRYWMLRFAPNDDLSDEEWEAKLDMAVNRSVKAHLVADVEFGVLLSGGVDSTAVATHMSRIANDRVKAFSIGFADADRSELPYAAAVARRLGLELHSEVVDTSALANIEKLAGQFGEPFGDSSALPTWHLARLARQFVPMVLSGDGGDEAFAGYTSYVEWMERAASKPQWQRADSFEGLRGIVRMLRRYLQAHWPRRRLDDWERYVGFVSRPGRRRLWRPEYRNVVTERYGPFDRAARDARGSDRLAYAQYLDYQMYLPNDILTKVDVAGMSHGLEIRTPLVDREIVELAATMPLAQRYRPGGTEIFGGKHVLKRLVAHEFSTAFVNREKTGFIAPIDRWFLPGAPGREYLAGVLLDPDSPLHEWFEPREIRAILQAHSDGKDNSGVLWLLLVLGLWMRANSDLQYR